MMLGSKLKGEVFPEGSGITVRKANARGGFGAKAGDVPQGIEDINANANAKATKLIRNGQVIIIRDNKGVWLSNKVFWWAIGIFELAVCIAIYFGGNALITAIR